MPLTHAGESRLVGILTADVSATLGPGYDAMIRECAAVQREFHDQPSDYIDKVVEDVQQHFHDVFIDTTWPRCPRHPNHPLWLHDEFWTCEMDRTRIAPLGGLARDSEL